MHQHGRVTAALAQGRNVQGNDIQPKVQVFAEGTVFVGRFQIAVGGRNHAHIDLHPLITAHRTNLFFLQHPQQLGLQLHGQFADFVEEDGAPVGGLEQSLLRFQRSGKSSLFVTKKLALDQRGHQRSAVDGDKRTIAKGPAEMHCPGHQFLARAAFPVDEHGRPCIL